MDMSFNISSPSSPQTSPYTLLMSPHGFVIPSPMDGAANRKISEFLQTRNEIDVKFLRSRNHMTSWFLDCCRSNNRQQMVDAREVNGLYDESSNEFRMYKFKVVVCTKESSHDWTECPFAHKGERARRRDPKLYSGETCPDYKKGYCRKGSACEFAHGLFETWLHPQRYKTQRCKDGVYCNRRVCFFAHGDGEIRCTSLSFTKPKNIEHSSTSKAKVGEKNSTPTRYACSNVAIPQAYNLGFQQQSFSSVAVPELVMKLPSYMGYSLCPSKSVSSHGSLTSCNFGSPCGLEDVDTALRKVDLNNDGLNYSVNHSRLLGNNSHGDHYSLHKLSELVGVNCGSQQLGIGEKISPEMYRKFISDQLRQKEYRSLAADQPDLAWVSELVEESV